VAGWPGLFLLSAKTPLKKASSYTINYTLALSITITKALLASLASLFRRRLGFLRDFLAKSHLLGGLGLILSGPI
jgi:hypothetical protein